MKLTIRFTKISPEEHRFEWMSDSGVSGSVELNTRSFLLHDLLHFAYETEGGLKDSFYGKLAAGAEYSALANEDKPFAQKGEIFDTERIVGPLTGVAKGNATPGQVFEGIKAIFDGYGDPLPEHLTKEFIFRVGERFAKLWGQWQGTPFGEPMELVFETGQ